MVIVGGYSPRLLLRLLYADGLSFKLDGFLSFHISNTAITGKYGGYAKNLQ